MKMRERRRRNAAVRGQIWTCTACVGSWILLRLIDTMTSLSSRDSAWASLTLWS